MNFGKHVFFEIQNVSLADHSCQALLPVADPSPSRVIFAGLLETKTKTLKKYGFRNKFHS